MKDKDFQDHLKFGNKYELEALYYIPYVKYELNNTSEYDIMCITKKGKHNYYEVKADRFIHKTNNICIEYMSNGIYSGISITKSNYYIIFSIKNDVIVEVYKIPTKFLKKYIEKTTLKSIRCGYNKLSCCYLINKDVFKKYKKQVKPTTPNNNNMEN